MLRIETIQALSSHPLPIAVLVIASAIFCRCFYRIYLHPLSAVPGPKLAACTSLWLTYHTYIGDECTVVYGLHQKYGPVLRVAPNDVDIAHLDAIEPLYFACGGFPKARPYSKFDLDGHATIFSTLNLSDRAARAKAVTPLFSSASIRSSQKALGDVFDAFVARLRSEARTAKPVNVLNAARAMAIDGMSAHLFHERYGAMTETADLMSASPFVDSCVQIGAFFNLVPGKMGDALMAMVERWSTNTKLKESHGLIDKYTRKLVQTAVPESGSYQSRLLGKLTAAQCQIELIDVCFAGTDSTAMNTASIMWYLTKQPDIYARLRQEVLKTTQNGEDPMTCAYLRGVIREGLRLSWSTPVRLPRLVPAGGWQCLGFHFPAETSVGVASYQLHQDSSMFHNPQQFEPERWDNPSSAMLTAFMPFGKGTRSCLAQPLATYEVTMSIFKVVEADLLRGATIVQDRIEIKEWFNTEVKGGEILVQFAQS
ncbi:cytochrome P450 [Aspergillus heteromorphus CBS 117.55]|uniref:Cytochrome P450 n=1 Tax=Aspergillus heteromorphus CBS 117.55 TaxID=1448321 RepID=A0A317VHF1_9EURO|nr:cytochrome P450 [Aspergillus heteromorphus CBS 117.55]PWY73733.1 cytochrome P450 [Aspergillus heteromorphus CBS 117.55]